MPDRFRADGRGKPAITKALEEQDDWELDLEGKFIDDSRPGA